jgi:hypothetical protein
MLTNCQQKLAKIAAYLLQFAINANRLFPVQVTPRIRQGAICWAIWQFGIIKSECHESAFDNAA